MSQLSHSIGGSSARGRRKTAGSKAVNRNLFFLHVPKTAGTSLRQYLVDQYFPDEVFPGRSWNTTSIAGLTSLRRHALIVGHFDCRILPMLPVPIGKVVFLRDPIARTLSAINHALVDPVFCPAGLNVAGRTVESIIRDPGAMKFFANAQVGALSTFGSKGSLLRSYRSGKVPTSDDMEINLEAAKKQLATFEFVGITEQFSLGLLQLAARFGLYPPVLPPRLNVGAANGQYDYGEYDEDDIRLVRSYSELDIQLYEYGKAINSTYPHVNRNELLQTYFEDHPPMIGELNLGTPFFGWGFYDAEPDNNHAFTRWSGPFKRSGVTLKLAAGTTYKIHVTYLLAGLAAATELAVSLGDTAIIGEITNEGRLFHLKFNYSVSTESAGLIELCFAVDRVSRPRALNPDDIRELGFMLCGLRVDKLSFV